MAAVRCRHNYRKYILSSEGEDLLLPIGRSLLVEAYPDARYHPFCGFMTVQDLRLLDSHDCVPVLNVEAFSTDPHGFGDWADVPSNRCVVAWRRKDGLVIPIYQDSLVPFYP